MVSASRRRAVARYLVKHYAVSERRACRTVGLSRTVHRYVSRRPPEEALRRRIREIATIRVRYGYKRIHVLLLREGHRLNRKRTYRLYCELGLQLRARRPRRHVSAERRAPSPTRPTAPNQAWSMDFVADQLVNGKRFRVLTVLDVFTREALALEPGVHLGAADVVATLTRVAARRGAPRRIYCDNGSEFCGRLVDLWAYHRKVTMAFSRPGKPTDHAHIESFNGSFRDECLNVHWFESLSEAKVKIEAWRRDYNASRPHRALNNLAPGEYAASWAERRLETH